jgi:hypothetical protein
LGRRTKLLRAADAFYSCRREHALLGDARLALRVSYAVAIVMLFCCGYVFGIRSGPRPWAAGVFRWWPLVVRWSASRWLLEENR